MCHWFFMKRNTVFILFVTAIAVIFGAYSTFGLTEPGSGELFVHFIDAGQGDSILIRAPSGKTMLIDGGDKGAGPGVVDFLRSLGIRRLDYVVSTHPHEDHIGGLIAVLENFPVGKVYDSGTPHTTATYERYLNLIDEKNIPFELGRAGKSINLGGRVTATILWPQDPLPENVSLNNASIVIRLVFGNVCMLFTGDIEVPVEKMLLSSGVELTSDVLKVAHHGSHTSSSRPFIEAVRPRIAIISCGAGNRYGHPGQQTLDTLTSVGVAIYRTDRHGTVTVRSDGEKFICSCIATSGQLHTTYTGAGSIAFRAHHLERRGGRSLSQEFLQVTRLCQMCLHLGGCPGVA